MTRKSVGDGLAERVSLFSRSTVVASEGSFLRNGRRFLATCMVEWMRRRGGGRCKNQFTYDTTMCRRITQLANEMLLPCPANERHHYTYNSVALRSLSSARSVGHYITKFILLTRSHSSVLSDDVNKFDMTLFSMTNNTDADLQFCDCM